MSEIFETKLTFGDLGLDQSIIDAASKLGFQNPTHIQAALIPIAISGKDCLGQAKTGTGKTASFGLPMLQALDPDTPMCGLVLVPTRELAIQIAQEIRDLGARTKHRITAVYGGEPIKAQVERLKKKPSLIIGTPGRVMDLHDRRLLSYDKIKMVILDEVDRMLDIGFRDDIRKILGKMKPKPQTIFVSATLSPEIERLARRYMVDPEKIVTTAKSLTVSRVNQKYLSVEHWDKRQLLLHLLTHEEPALTLVFCRTKRTVDSVAKYLESKKIDVQSIHGDMYQKKRNRVIQRLRKGDLKVLICSDLAARGLDIDDITHVINYDIPEDPEVYVHRIGRTARVGRDGVAWSFVCPDQGSLLTGIEMLTNVEIERLEYPDFKPGPVPQDVQAKRELDESRKTDEISTKRRDNLPDTPTDSGDSVKFPGGLVPTGLPSKRLGGRLRSGRR